MKLTWVNSTSLKNGFRIIKTKMTKSIIETSKQSMPFGFDANPSKNYVAILADTLSNEEPVVIGYLNPNALDDLNIGDSIMYSTDADGNIKSKVIARNDGTFEILGNNDNAVRFSKLKSAYDQLKSDHDALVDAFNTHVHATAAVGPPVPPTPAPPLIPATKSTGDISGSKIDEIKVPK